MLKFVSSWFIVSQVGYVLFYVSVCFPGCVFCLAHLVKHKIDWLIDHDIYSTLFPNGRRCIDCLMLCSTYRVAQKVRLLCLIAHVKAPIGLYDFWQIYLYILNLE